MHQAHERGIMRWHIHTALLSERIAQIDDDLRHIDLDHASMSNRNAAGAPDVVADRDTRRQHLLDERATLTSRLRGLGPSPQAKMG